MKYFDYEASSGLKFTHMDDAGDFLNVESAKLPQTIDYIRAHGPIQLYLNWRRGFLQKNLSFLAGIEILVEGLIIVVDKMDLEGIENCVNLKYLQLSDDYDQPIAFDQFSCLTSCFLQWNKSYSLATFPYSLAELRISSYNSQFGFNKSSLHNLRNITKLTLTQAAIDNLSLIQYCGPLTRLDIAYGRTLTDISALTIHADSLTHLDIDKCKKIIDFAPLRQLIKLQWLNLCDCKSIPSLAFVQYLPALDHCVFFGTTVEDGDLSYLKGISQVAFNNKPHYSLKMKDFESTT